jgi:hypothetical protein
VHWQKSKADILMVLEALRLAAVGLGHLLLR